MSVHFTPEQKKIIRMEYLRNMLPQVSLVSFLQEYMPDRNMVEPAPYHFDWSNILLNGTGHFAVEAFRESGKTQVAIRSNLAHSIAFPRMDRFYLTLICNNVGTASKKVRELSRTLKSEMNGRQDDRKLSVLVDDIAIDNDTCLMVKIRKGRSDTHIPDYVRIEAFGKGSAIRGLSWNAERPHIIICDDLQDIKDTNSEATCDNDMDWFLGDIIFLGENSRIFLIGNNLGARCIIEQIIKNANLYNFEWSRIPVMKDGESAWPAKYSVESITNQMQNMAATGYLDTWYREKMCEIVSPDSQTFKPEYFRYYEHHADLNLKGMNTYILVDPASAESKRSDFNAIVCVAINPDNVWFVLDVFEERTDPTQTMDAIFDMVGRWHPKEVGIEGVAYQSSLKHFLEKEMLRRSRFFTIVPLKAKNAKEERIRIMQPRFKIGGVWFQRQADWTQRLEQQLLAFPKGLHDDVIDALAYTEQIGKIPDVSHSNITIPMAGAM